MPSVLLCVNVRGTCIGLCCYLQTVVLLAAACSLVAGLQSVWLDALGAARGPGDLKLRNLCTCLQFAPSIAHQGGDFRLECVLWFVKAPAGL